MAKDGDTVKVHYKGTLDDGSVFDTSRGKQPLEFILGSGNMIVGFDKAVKGMQVGEIKTVTITPEEACGPRHDDLVAVIKREQLSENVHPEIGQRLQTQHADGSTIKAIVTNVSEASITVDANHPLAGKDLTFEIELVEIN